MTKMPILVFRFVASVYARIISDPDLSRQDMLREKGKFPVSSEFAPPEWIDTILLRFFIGFKRNVSDLFTQNPREG